jgi:branched-chain amino acid aminotransferase
MTATAGSIMPVRSVDGKAVSDHGGAREASIQLHNLYWEKRWAAWHATPMHYERVEDKP